MNIRALPYVLLTGFLFGSTLVASRFSVGQFQPLTYITIRLVIASAGFLLLFALRPELRFPTSRQIWLKAGVLGIFGTALNLVAIVSALQYISSGVTSVLLTLSPALTVLLAHLALPTERLILRQWLGVALAFGGAILLAIAGESGIPNVANANPLGYLFVFAAITSGSLMTIYTRQVLRELDSVQVASVRMFVAALAVLPLALLGGEQDFSRVDPAGIFAVLYASLIGTFAGFFSQLMTVQRFGAVPGSMVTYVIPIFAGLGGIFLLGETFTPLMAGGVLIIFSGIALVQRIQRGAALPARPLEAGD